MSHEVSPPAPDAPKVGLPAEWSLAVPPIEPTPAPAHLAPERPSWGSRAASAVALGGIRRYRDSRSLDRVESRIPTQEEAVKQIDDDIAHIEVNHDAHKRYKYGKYEPLEGHEPTPGADVVPGHDRRLRKLARARAKIHTHEAEQLGARRHIGRAVLDYREIWDERDKRFRTIPVAVSDLGSYAHDKRIDAEPRTRKELALHADAAHEHIESRHHKKAIWDKALEATVQKERGKLWTLHEDRYKLQDKLAKRGGYVEAFRDRDNRINRARRTVRSGVRDVGYSRVGYPAKRAAGAVKRFARYMVR